MPDEEYDDELEHVLDEVTRRGPIDEGDDVTMGPLCRECVRELPAVGSDLCEFCQVITP